MRQIRYAAKKFKQSLPSPMKLPNIGKPATPTNNRAAAKLRISLGLAAAGGSLAAGLCFGAAKADILFTTNAGRNGHNGNIFDISANKSITITGFYQNFFSSGLHNFAAYYRLGTAVSTNSNTP